MRSITILTLIFSFSLAGCSSPSDIAEEAIAKASAVKNPIAARNIIKSARADLDDFCRNSLQPCEDRRHQLAAIEDGYVADAAVNGDSFAVREFIDRVDNDAVEKNLVPKILKQAEDSQDRNILFAAARIYGAGVWVSRDTNRQIEYLTKAWSLGDIESAGVLATALAWIKDYQGAYLWSLRCTSGCVRDFNIGLNYLEEHLSSAQILSIQNEAGKKTLPEKIRRAVN